MTKVQEAKLDMYRATQQVCTDNESITADNVAFTNTRNAFFAKVSALISMATLEKKVISGVATDKNEQKDNLAQQAAGIAGLIFAFADASDNSILKDQTDFTEADLKKLKDNELPLTCNDIITTAKANLPDLADYGITDKMINGLQETINEYSDAVPKTKGAKSLKSSQKKSIKEMIKEIDAHLKKQLDKLVISYKASNVDFVNAYKSARVIIDPARRKAKPAVDVSKAA